MENLLAKAVKRHLDVDQIYNAKPLTGGAASTTWRFEIDHLGHRKALILRCSEAVEQMSGGISKSTECTVQSLMFEHGIPVAEVLFALDSSDQLGEGYVMSCIEGESIPRKILRDNKFDAVRDKLVNQCGQILANIHAISPPEVLPRLDIHQQLAELETEYFSYNTSIPAFDLAFRWLKLNAKPCANPCIVHGDFRHGNFLVSAENGINGVLDWELCHVGDPMEDLGWLCVNSWRFGNRNLTVGGFGHLADLVNSYERHSGQKVNIDHVKYWELYGVLKWGIICLYMLNADLANGEISLERQAIGRRISETEIDILTILAGTETHD